MSSKKNTVATPSAGYMAMLPNLELVNAVKKGTDAMRAAETKFLPREPKESKEAYKIRLSRSVLYNAYADTIKKLVGKPFSKTVTVNEDTPDIIKELTEDIDRMGNNITSFCRELLESALTDGITHILIDYPLTPEKKNLEQKKQDKIRPYAVHVKASNLIAWAYESVNGIHELKQLRILESVTIPDGEYGEKIVNRIRVVKPDSFEVYEEGKKDNWQLIETGENSLGEIALVTFYTEKTGFMTAKPPLLDLAHLNVQHWQSSSDQEHILHFVRFPLLHGAGFNPNAATEIEIGPDRMVVSEDPQSRLQFVEHSGAAIEAGRESLKDLETKMESLGIQLLLKRTGNVTATESAIDSAKSNSALQDMVRRLENAISKCFEFMCKWEGQEHENYGGISINQDFGLSQVADGDEEHLLKARLAGEISQKSYLTELKRRNIIREDLDIDDEIEAIGTENPKFPNEE